MECITEQTSQNNKSFLILASGKGSNAINLWKHAKLKNYKCLGIFSNRKDSEILSYCKTNNIPHFCIRSSKYSKDEYNRKLKDLLQDLKVDWLVLAGYMKILPHKILKNFFNSKINKYQIINIHPSLLPNYPGLNSYERAFTNGDFESGISIHFVDEGMDTGPILLQEKFLREEQDELADFIEKGKSLEHQMFPKALDIIMNTTKELIDEV